MTMKTLPENFTTKGFEHRQLKRIGNIAIFERFQSKPEKCHYEVIRIQSHNGRTIAGNFIPPAEFYPSTSQWGSNGFTYTEGQSGSRDKALKQAEERFSQLLEA